LNGLTADGNGADRLQVVETGCNRMAWHAIDVAGR
jgi:hypothetical protein